LRRGNEEMKKESYSKKNIIFYIILLLTLISLSFIMIELNIELFIVLMVLFLIFIMVLGLLGILIIQKNENKLSFEFDFYSTLVSGLIAGLISGIVITSSEGKPINLNLFFMALSLTIVYFFFFITKMINKER